MNAELKLVVADMPCGHEAESSARVADALLSHTQQQVLGLLFGSPEQSFNASEIIQRAGCGSGTVQRELARLHACGLLTLTRVGLQKRYQANPRSPAYEAVRRLILTLQSPWLGLQTVLTSLPGQVTLAAAIPPHTNTREWSLVLVADDLTLQQVYTALHEVEQHAGYRFTITLHATPDWQALSPTKRERLCPAATAIHILPAARADALP